MGGRGSRRAMRYILFDAVGTLIYPEPSVAAAYQAAAQRHGLEIDEATIADRFPLAYRSAFSRLDQLVDEATDRLRWRAVVHDVFEHAPQSDAILADLWDHFAEP